MVETCTSTGSYTMGHASESEPIMKFVPTPVFSPFSSPATSNDNQAPPQDLNEKEIHAVQQAQLFMSELKANLEFDPARYAHVP